MTGTTLGGAGLNAVLCKTCSVLCVFEQTRVDNSNADLLVCEVHFGSNWSNWLKAGPVV